MPTARSSADPLPGTPAHPTGPAQHLGPALALVPLLRFWLGGRPLRARIAMVLALLAAVTTTVLAAVVPARADLPADLVPQVRLYLPAAVVVFLLTSVVAGVSSGGGREMLPADQAVAFPIGSTTDHLASLLWAPLNLAWLVQAWTLVASAAIVGGRGHLVATVLPMLLWVATATAVAQAVAWGVEIVRQSRHGVVAIRVAWGVGGAGVLVASFTGRAVDAARVMGGSLIADTSSAGSEGRWLVWLLGCAGLVIVCALAVGVGARAARQAARRPPRTQATVETRVYAARPDPRSEFFAMLRIDRASVWRSAPLRRGIIVLAILPMLVALAGQLRWETIPVLPGLVASGVALLFGVNAWCLDARGTLWRESLPVAPRVALAARTWVMVEMLLVSGGATLVVCGLRAGPPPRAEQLVATIIAAVVICVRIVASSLRWSVRRPYAMDLRRARATPAPPGVMLGYSARLAVTSSVTGVAFSAVGQSLAWTWSAGLGAVLLATSAVSLVRTARRWEDPVARAVVTRTVASL